MAKLSVPGEWLSQESKPQRDSSYLLSERPSMLTLITPTIGQGPKANPRPARLLSVLSPARTRWDLFIMSLAVWNCFYVPFSVAFAPEKEIAAFTVVDVFIDIAYLFDIIVFAKSTYIDLSTGEEVTNPRKILKNYVTSFRFAIDLLSAFPWDVLALVTADNNELQLFTLSKVFRLLRFSKALMFLQAKVHVKLVLKLLHLIFLFVTYLHLVACLWFLLISQSQKYTPPALYIVHHPDLYISNIWKQYAFSMYMSVYMLTGAEIGPRTEWERIFAGCALIVGQLFQAFMFGEIAVVLFDLNKRSDKIAEIQEASMTTMINMHLDFTLRGKVSAFWRSLQGAVTREQEHEEFFSILPPSLKQEVRSILFASVLHRNPYLSDQQPISEAILNRLLTMYCQPERTVVKQGNDGDSLFFVVSGKCEVEVVDEQEHTNFVKILLSGSHFGEVALLYPTTRTATVKALNYVILAVLERVDFDFICLNFPDTRSLMEVSALRYLDVRKQFQLEALRRCVFFHSLSDKELSRILYEIPIATFNEGNFLCKEDEVCENAFLILEGEVEVYTYIRERRLTTTTALNLLPQEDILKALRDRFAQYFNQQYATASASLCRVTFEKLGPGCVICPVSMVLGEKVGFFARAARMTLTMKLSSELLGTFKSKHKKIQSSVNGFLSTVSLVSNAARLRRDNMLAMDYEKMPTRDESETLLSGRMKVKRTIMRKLLERRKLRNMGFNDVFTMSNKLRALAAEEEITDIQLLEKIRVGVAPTSEHLISAYKMLEVAEVRSSLLIQFAIHTAKVAETLTRLSEKMKRIKGSVKDEKRRRVKARADLTEIKKIADLCTRLEYAVRMQQGRKIEYR